MSVKTGEMMYGVLYDYSHKGYVKNGEYTQVTQSRLDKMHEYRKQGMYYTSVQVIEVFDEQELTNLETWLAIGQKNTWISQAYDPPFDITSFAECKTLDYLIGKFLHGNWCTGAAFYYKNMCFINQASGGDEWLTIRDDINFESWSCGHVISEHGKERFIDTLNRMMAATPEQLRTWTYMEAGPVVNCVHCNNKLYPGSSVIYQSPVEPYGNTCDSCWTDKKKKLYIKAIENKVRANERVTLKDVKFVELRDKFITSGAVGLEGWFIIWTDQFAVGMPKFDKFDIVIYHIFGDGTWKEVDAYIPK